MLGVELLLDSLDAAAGVELLSLLDDEDEDDSPESDPDDVDLDDFDERLSVL
ncbi:MAG TPA: hypothetical protein VNQ73_07785 [Ilumatobacter sp.]|nr:hypothetical protein [Ilumatobacter sp.]